MPWPQSQDYNEAIQSPASVFADAELRSAQAVVGPLGVPMPRSGNFADVYELRSTDGSHRWAVKCFTRAVPGQRERYAAIAAALAQARLRFTVDFQYLEHGIRIGGAWYPVLKMDWVEGLLLNEFVRQHADNPVMLEALAALWARLAGRMRNAGLAHGDLQHGNILLVPGRDEKHLALKLIDYDGMFVPALAALPSGEVGHPAYQHPQRLREGTYNADIDRFPLLVVYTALRALVAGGRALWERYDYGDNLLFRAPDFNSPTKSPLLAELLKMPDPLVRRLARILIDASIRPIQQTPTLEGLIDADNCPAPANTWSPFLERLGDPALPASPLHPDRIPIAENGPEIQASPLIQNATEAKPQEAVTPGGEEHKPRPYPWGPALRSFAIWGVSSLFATGCLIACVTSAMTRFGAADQMPGYQGALPVQVNARAKASIQELEPKGPPKAPGEALAQRNAPSPLSMEHSDQPKTAKPPPKQLLEARLKRSRELLRQAEPTKALTILGEPEPVVTPSNDADLHTLRGIALLRSKRYTEALDNIREAVRLDPTNAEAALYLGWLYLYGNGAMPPNYITAMLWLRKASDLGDPESVALIGKMYLAGYGVPPAPVEAFKWYKKAADQGEPLGMFWLAGAYANGSGINQDKVIANNLYQAARIRLEHDSGGRPIAMVVLGQTYNDGLAIPANPVVAFKWFRQAAELGEATGMDHLGWMYANGRGVNRDDVLACRWYREGASLGSVEAMNNLGWMHTQGRGVPQDDYEAVKWYRKAADLGNAPAMVHLGWMYENGRGVHRSGEEAARCYRMAAKLGSEAARQSLRRLGQ